MNEDTKMIEAQQQTVQFQPKFLVGTRKNAVNILFSLRVRNAGSDVDHAIESELSNPFVVITNECQWAEAEGTLIKKEAFGTHVRIFPLLMISLFEVLTILTVYNNKDGSSVGPIRECFSHALHQCNKAGHHTASPIASFHRDRIPARKIFQQQSNDNCQGIIPISF